MGDRRKNSFFKSFFQKNTTPRLSKRPPAFDVLEDRTTPTGATLNWTGAVSGSWNDPGNWAENSTPSGTGDTLIFNANSAATYATVNDTAVTSLAGIQVIDSDTTAGHDFSFSGTAVTLTGAFATSGTDATSQTSLGLGLGGASGSLQQGSAGTLLISANNSYGGNTDVNSGTLKLNATPYGPVASGLSSWYDASNSASIHTSGSMVTQWDDISGNGHNAIRGNGTPTYQPTGGPNGLPSVRVGNDNGDHGWLDTVSGAVVKETFIVFKSNYSSNAFGGDWGSPFGDNTGDYNGAGAWMFQGNTTKFWDQSFPTGVSRNGVTVAQNNGNGDRYALGGNVNQYFILMVDRNNANGNPHTYSIGRQDGWTRGDMSISEIITYDHVLTPTEKSQVGGYLEYKYVLSSAYTPIGPTDQLPDASPVTVASGATLAFATTQTETIGQLTNNGTVTVVAGEKATASGLSGTAGGANVAVGAGATLTVSQTVSSSYAGTLNIGASGTFAKSGSGGNLQLTGAISMAASADLAASDGTLTVTNVVTATSSTPASVSFDSGSATSVLNLQGDVHLQNSSVVFGGAAGNINVSGIISGGISFPSSPISGMVTWYDLTGAHASSVHTSGTTITAWDDVSGNGHHTHQAGGTVTLSATGGPNGGPVAQFRNSWLDTNVANMTTVAETYAVFKSAYNGGSTFGPDWGSPFGAVGDYTGSWMLQGNTRQFWGDGCCQPSAVSFNGVAVAQNNSNGFWGVGYSDPSIGVGQYFALKVDNNGQFRNNLTYSLGRMNGWTNSYMDVAEVITYDHVLTSTEQANMQLYFAGKYNIAPPRANLTKAGGSTLTLSGANTYDGTTTITGGTLVTGAANTIPGTSEVTINGATAAFSVGTASPTISKVHLLNGSITGSTGVLSSPADFDLQNGTVSAKLGGSTGVAKTTSGTVTMSGANTYTGNTTVTAGVLDLGSNSTIPTGAGKGNLVVNGTLEMHGYNLTVNGLSGTGAIRSTHAGTATLSVGNNNTSSTFSGSITDVRGTTANGLIGYGYNNRNDGFYMNLNNNDGMVNKVGASFNLTTDYNLPKAVANYYGSSVLTSGPQGIGFSYNTGSDSVFIDPTLNGGGLNTNTDNYSNLWLTKLHVSAADAGVWHFRVSNQDDAAGSWIDLNQDGIFGTNGGGVGTNSGGAEQLSWGDGGDKTVTLAAGDYLMAFTHVEGGGDSRMSVNFTSPTLSDRLINPSDPTQAGLWLIPVEATNDPSLGAGGGTVNLQKIGSGALTLSGSNFYHGTTTISTGTIKSADAPVANGLSSWYDASKSSSIHLSGTTVTQWDDISGNGHNAVVANSQPTFQATGGPNGLPSVRVGNSTPAGNFGWLDTVSGAVVKETFIVFKSNYSSTAFDDNNWGSPFGDNTGDYNGAGGWMFQGNTTRFWDQSFPTAVARNGATVNQNNGSGNYDLGGGVNQYFILAVDRNNANGNPHTYSIGRQDGWQEGDYSISEIVTYDHVLTANEQSAVGAYLANKYGISTSYVAPGSPVAYFGTSTNAIPDTSAVVIASGATLDLSTSSAETLGSLSGPAGAIVKTGGVLTLAGSGTAQLDAPVTGSGSIVKSGSGTQVLTGDDTYPGTTTISGGVLQLDGTKHSGSVTVTGTGVLAGVGYHTFSNATLTVANATTPLVVDGSVSPGAAGGGIDTLEFAGLTLNASNFSAATYNADLNVGGGSSDQLHIDGPITLGNTATNFYPILNLNVPTGTAVGDYQIIFSQNGVTPTGQFAGLPNGQLFAVNGQALDIHYNSTGVVVHNYGSTGTYYADPSFTAGSITDADPVAPGDQPATFGVNAFSSINAAIAAASANSVIIVNPGTYSEAVNVNKAVILYLQQVVGAGTPVVMNSLASGSVGVIQLSNGVGLTVGNGTSTALNIPIIGIGSLTKQGSGTLTLGAINGYNGTTTITDTGALRTGVAAALPGGAITIGANAHLQLGGISQDFSGDVLGAGTIENASGVDATVTFGTGGVNQTFAGTLANGTGAGKLLVTKAGSGTLSLTGSGTYSGQTTVNGGNFRAGATNVFSPNSSFVITSPGKVQLYGYDNALLATSGTGTVENGGATNVTLTFNASTAQASSAALKNGFGNGTLAVAKTGSGTLTFSGANTFSGGTSITNGIIVPAAAGAFFGTGSFDIGASGKLQLGGYDITIPGLTGSGIVEDANVNDATLTVGVTNDSTFSGTIRDGAGGGSLKFNLNNPPVRVAGNGFTVYTFYNNPNDDPLLNLAGNKVGSIYQNGDPTTAPGYQYSTLVTNGPNGDGFRYNGNFQNPGTNVPAQGLIDGGHTDNFQLLFTSVLHVSPANAGTWNFNLDGLDDRAGIWVDVNGDGVFSTPGQGLGGNQGEQVGWQGGGNVTLAAGDYLVAFTFEEYGGGESINYYFTSPGSGQRQVNPSDPTQVGLWTAGTPNHTALTLTGNNTYTGDTTVQAGTLIVGSNTALGSAAGGTTVISGASLGFANNVTVSGEAITADGTGAPTRSGAIVNISGTNSYTGTVVAAPVDLGTLGIGSDAGTLTLNNIQLVTSNLVVGGSANFNVTGTISGDLSGSAPPSPDQISGLALWLDASDINGNGSNYTRGSVSYWHDKSGNNHDLMYVFGHNPTYVANSSNGKPAVAFDGSNALGLDIFNNPEDNPQSFITAGGNVNGQYTLVSVARYTGGNNQTVIASETNQDWRAGFYNGNNRWYANGWGSLDQGSPGNQNNSSWTLHAMQNNINNASSNPANNYYYNGIQVAAASTGTGDDVIADNVPNGLQLGAWQGTNNGSQAQVSEVLMFNRVLSTLELQGLERFLNSKYTFNSESLDALPAAANSVTKTGSGTVTFSGNNSYSGSTTINGGVLIAGSNNALGAPTGGGATVAAGATLGLQGNATIPATKTISIAGAGASGQPGAIANVSGSNSYLGTLTLAPVAPNFDVSIGSTAGTLTLNTVSMGAGNAIFNGAGNVVVSGVMSGSVGSGGSPVTSHLSAWFDASNSASVHRTGTSVTQWDDISGNGHHAVTQAGDPTYQATGGPNSLPAIRVGNDNGDHGFLNTVTPLTNAETFVVLKSNYSSNAFGGDWGTPWGVAGGDYGGGWMFQGGTTQFWDGTYPQVVTRNGINVPFNNPNGDRFALGGGVDQYFVLMVDSRSDFHNTIYSIGNMNNQAWRRGDYSISEILSYDQVLSSGNIAQVQTYLKNKYHLGQGDNSVTKNGTGTVTLSGANTYIGATAINAGTLVAANANALGTTGSGTTIAGSATLGFQGGVTTTEPLTVGSGTGAAGMAGTLTNISGDNVIAASTAVTIPVVNNGQVSIGSLANKLTVNPNIDLKVSGIVVNGAGDVTINGIVSSSTPTGINDPTQADVINSYGPLSFWQFNEGSGTSTADGGAANNTGTLVNGATWTAGRTGNSGDYAMDTRPGNGAEMDTSTVNTMYQAVQTNNAVTIGFWMWQDPLNGSRQNPETFRALQGGTRVAFTHTVWDNDQIYWDAGQGERIERNTNDLGHPYDSTGTNPAAYTGGWHQYVMTKSSSSPNYQAIYIDGQLLYSNTGSQTFGLIDNLTLAANFRGRMDDAFLLGTALTQSQVTALWDTRNGLGVLPAHNTVTMNGTGTLRIYGAQQYQGDTTVNNGVLGGVFTTPGNIVANPPGVYSPGSSPGSITSQNLTLTSSSTLREELNGPTAYTPGNPINSYDQTIVSPGGTVNLGFVPGPEPSLGAILDLHLGYAPTDGTIYKIIDNQGSNDVQGTFFGLSQNATVTATYNSVTYNFRISYTGGDGNDVTLTNYSLVPHVTSVSPFIGPTTGGNTVIITGSGFTGVAGANHVQFGGVNALSYNVDSSSQITAVAPAEVGNVSLVDVRVTNGSLTSDNTSADDYSYVRPSITSVVTNGLSFVTLTGATWSSGNPQVTVPSTAGLSAGNLVSSLGNGFPFNATILSVDSPTTFTLSSNPTAAQGGAGATIKAVNAPKQSGTVLTLTGATWSNGSTTVTVASTANLVVGQYLSSTGTGLPANATVASITDANTFELNIPATGNQASPTTISVADAAVARDGFGQLVDLTGASSVVQNLVVTFNIPVKLDADAFSMTGQPSGFFSSIQGIAPSTATVHVATAGVPGTGSDATGYTQYVLNFIAGAGTNSFTNAAGGSHGNAFATLKNGVFRLDTVGSKVHAGVSDVADDRSDNLWSLYGAVNAGDIKITGAVGGGNDSLLVDGFALNDIYQTFGSFVNGTSPAYVRAFDHDLDGDIDGSDLNVLYQNFSTIWKF